MEISTEIATVAGGVGGVGGLVAWMIRRMISRIEDGQDKLMAELVSLKLAQAESRGKDELVWREINTDKHKIVELQSSNKKLWEVISRVAPERPSDRIKDLLERALKDD